MKNVKLDWAPILEGQVKHLESVYPDIPVRKSFVPIIEALNTNKIMSRVILSGINVSAYAFITPSQDLTDRIYGSVGFTNPAFATEERINKLLSWLEDIARLQQKYVMLNEIFNAEEVSEKVLLSHGFTKFVRNRLVMDLSSLPGIDAPLKGEFDEIPINRLKHDAYSDAEFDAFSGTDDQILFNSGNRKERIEFSKGLFAGKFGPVLEPASRILSQGKELIGSTICTQYRSLDGAKTALLVDIFVNRKYQGQGIAKHLLMFSLRELKKLGYEECALWVSSRNPAKKLYEKIGFKETKTSEIFYYRKP